MALEQVHQLHSIDNISVFLGLSSDAQQKIELAKKLLTQCKDNKEDKKQFKTTRAYMKSFHQDTNSFFKSWMSLFYSHQDKQLVSEDWFEQEDQIMQPPAPVMEKPV